MEYEWLLPQPDEQEELLSFVFVKDQPDENPWVEVGQGKWELKLDFNSTWSLGILPKTPTLGDRLSFEIVDEAGGILRKYQSKKIIWDQYRPSFVDGDPIELDVEICLNETSCESISMSLPINWSPTQAGEYFAWIEQFYSEISFSVLPFQRDSDTGRITVKGIVEYLRSSGNSGITREEVKELLKYVESYYQ